MIKNRLQGKSNIAFIVELFIMFLLLIVVIVVITMVSMTSREQSLEASDLTKAVICAENTAEVTATATDAEEAAKYIEKMEGAKDVTVSGDKVTADIDEFSIEMTLTPDKGSAGTYVDELITIYLGDDEEIYSLHTGRYKED